MNSATWIENKENHQLKKPKALKLGATVPLISPFAKPRNMKNKPKVKSK
jgi:hypothetical protein